MLNQKEEKVESDLVLFLDRPETSDLKFGYRVTVDWLKDILKNAPKPFRLAITGSLGAGKSTLIRNALDELEKDEGSKIISAYVDVWKLDKESARRSAIMQIIKEFELDGETVKKIERDIYGITTDVADEDATKSLVDKNKPIKKMFFTALPFAIVLAVIVYVVLGRLSSEASSSAALSERAKIFLALLTGFATATYTVISNLFVNMFVNIKNTVSRAPLVGPEEFEKCLRLILQSPQLAKKKVVIVFDNIDRAPVERTQEILTGLSAFFDDSSESYERNLIIAVPFAQGANQGLSSKTTQKFFDAVVPLPEIISQDLTEYAEDLIAQSIWAAEKKEIAELVTLGPNKTPREIIHCVNELLSLLHLARQMEQKGIQSTDGSSTGEYLSPGMVTKNVLTYTKIIVCQSIWPEFLRNGVSKFWSVDEMFSPEKYKHVVSEARNDEEKERIQELTRYLTSTTGLPNQVPYSAEPFYHLKGADELLKIQGGPEIERALVLREPKTVEQYLAGDEQKQRVQDLKSIFKFCIKKYKNSNQRKKNTVVSMLSALVAQKIADKESAELVAEQLLKNPDLISEVGVSQISFITPVESGRLSNEGLWKLMDAEYAKKQKKEDKSEKDEDWSTQYLAEVLLQPSGVQRAKVNSKDFNLKRLSSERIISALGTGYPSTLSSPATAVETIEHYIQRSFLISTFDEMKRANTIIVSGLSTANKDIAAQLHSSLTNAWNFFGNNLPKADFSEQSLIGASFILGAMPGDDKCPSNIWQQNLLNNLNGRHADFQRMVSTSRAGMLLFFMRLGDKNPIQNFGNLLATYKSAVSNLTSDDMKKLVEYCEGWSWFAKVWSIAQTELRSRLANDTGALEFVLMNCDESVAAVIKSEWSNFKNSSAFALVLKKPNLDKGVSRRDWIEIIAKNPSQFTPEVRRQCLESTALELPKIDVGSLIDHEINELGDLKNASFLIEWLSKNDTAKLEKVVDGSEEYLRKSTPESWNTREICNLKIVAENLNKDVDDPYEQIIDKAIQRGIKDGASATVSKSTAEMVLKILSTTKGLNKIDAVEESISKTTKLSDDQKKILESEINTLRVKNNLQKKGLLEKLKSFKKD